MKALTIIACTGAVGLAALGVAMATTNPSVGEYEDYAAQRLTDYLKQDVCQKTTNFLENLIKSQCQNLVDQATPQMREILGRSTQQQNFVIFSVYKTDLKLSSFIPIYKFETVGAFNNFYTYTAEQQ
ncbi:DUF4359 domain-containing protein [Nodularia sphaerocarpa]|uniref:DUF4359 domain-containing protein n=1 Tax=Nodularia sphaerocarpa TaxID=137816 RepID=UPI001EFB5632|nr:DUF4359 domain-containing protein [Nodularia sphaerocarpa]MDB9372947.1 DUF4359 domain-containing protein [Nodularia sphaerocarpa CS-585]MDB9377473.1 DUF4359 domain-containing protein [Nodularia sphaerocarpa CS-585A2]ULP71686.1 hypothetical protein BDGGKGIB_01319 [Nodularia sphaerocarpa UHCC 0038]